MLRSVFFPKRFGYSIISVKLEPAEFFVKTLPYPITTVKAEEEIYFPKRFGYSIN